jgi:amino acid transporter
MGTDAPPSTGRAIQGHSRLPRGRVGWRLVAVVSIAGLGPASGMALNLQLISPYAGAGLVLAILACIPIILLMVFVFREYSRRIASTGGLYTWSARAWGAPVGFVYGWTFVGAYYVLSAAGFAVFGGWMSQFFKTELNTNVPWWLLSAAALIYVTGLAIRGITSTLHAAYALLAFEVVLLVVLSVSLLLHAGPSHWTVTPFTPGAFKGTLVTSFGLALSYGIFNYIGIEEGSTLGGEARDGRKDVGKGLWVAGIFVSLLFLLVSYAAVVAWGVGKMKSFSADAAPLQTLSHHIWGGFGEGLVVLVVGSSILAWSQTAFNAGARVMFTLGDEGVLPRPLAKVSSRGAPWSAIYAMAAITIALGAPMAFEEGPFGTYAYYGFLIVVAFVVAYIVVEIGLIRLTIREGDFSLIRHGLPAVIGALFLAYTLYRTLYPFPVGVYATLTWVYVAWMVIGIAILMIFRARRPEVIERVGSAMALTDGK